MVSAHTPYVYGTQMTSHDLRDPNSPTPRDTTPSKPEGQSLLAQSAFDKFMLFVSIGWSLVMISIVTYAYFGISWTDAISYQVADGWCNSRTSGIGHHCFGDFGFPYYRGGFPEVYVPGNLAAANTPLIVRSFEFLRLLPYNAALSIYLFALAASPAAVMWWGSRFAQAHQRAFAVVFIGIGSLGTLVALDRGNAILIMAPLALAFIVALETGHSRRAIVTCALLISLKFWGVLFVIAFVARRKYRDAVVTLVATVAFNAILLATFYGGLTHNVRTMLTAAGDGDYAVRVTTYSISLIGLIRRASCGGLNVHGCNVGDLYDSWSMSTVASGLLVIAFAFAAWIAIAFLPRKSAAAWIPLLAMPIVALPESGTYNAVLAVVMAALIMRWPPSPTRTHHVSLRHQELLYSLGIICTTLTIVPLVIYVTGNSPLFLAEGLTGPMLRSQYIVIPVVWALYTFISSCLILASRRPYSKLRRYLLA
jgi:hypothetical protein